MDHIVLYVERQSMGTGFQLVLKDKGDSYRLPMRPIEAEESVIDAAKNFLLEIAAARADQFELVGTILSDDDKHHVVRALSAKDYGGPWAPNYAFIDWAKVKRGVRHPDFKPMTPSAQLAVTLCRAGVVGFEVTELKNVRGSCQVDLLG